MEKNGAQISGFAVTEKPPSPSKKKFSKKKFFQLIFVDILQSGGRKFFLNKWVSRYLSLGDFKVPKNCSSQQNYQ